MPVSKTTNNRLGAVELRGSLTHIRYPAFCELKLDGEFNYFFYGQDRFISVNKYGTIREGYPQLEEAKPTLKHEGIKSGIFAGEVYVKDGKLGELYELLKVKNHPEKLSIRFFDMPVLHTEEGVYDGRNLTLIERKELMLELLLKHTSTNGLPIKSFVVESNDDVQMQFKVWTELGFEGVVVKNYDERWVYGVCGWVKLKHKDENEYKVAVIDPILERIEVLVPRPDGTFRNVGCKVSNADKGELYLGDTVKIEHQGILSGGGLRHPVYKGKV